MSTVTTNTAPQALLDNEEKISVWEKMGYGTGDLASCLIWGTLSMYLMYFYTDIFGISAAAAGFMIMILRALDAFVDPGVGVIADRTRTKMGKYRPYLIWFSIPFAVAVIFTFTTPAHLTGGHKLLYAYISYGSMMILYSVVNIPYSALLGVVTNNPVERTSFSSFKYLGAYLGGFVVSISLLPLAAHFGGNNIQHGWSIVMTLYIIAAVILFYVAFLSSKERVSPPPAQKRTPLIRDIKDLTSNLPWIILFIVSLLMILMSALGGTLSMYYFKYYVGTQVFMGHVIHLDVLASFFNTTGQIVTIIGVLVVPFIVKRFGKKKTFIAYFIIAAVIGIPTYFIAPNQLGLMFLINIIGNFFGGPTSVLLWAMYADSADYSEWKHGRRATALVFSVAILAQKLAWAVASGICGFLLSAAGFDANHVQDSQVIHLILNLRSFIPLYIGIVGIVFMFFYSLNDKKIKQVNEELAARRELQAHSIEVTK